MDSVTSADLVSAFTEKLTQCLDESKLSGPVRMDNTHTVVIIPVQGKGPIHVHAQQGVGEDGVENVVEQIRSVPGLKGLLTEN